MNSQLRIALLIGVVTIAADAAYAQLEGPLPPDGPLQGIARSRGPIADRLLDAFDVNHDGKITHDEMNRTIGARFAAATQHAPSMTLDRFMSLHQDEFRRHAAETFRRLDWEGDGRLSLADYGAPQRVRFMTMDENGSGTVSCAQAQNPTRNGGNRVGNRNRGQRRSSARSFGTFGVAAFCFDNDLDRDGNVTRAELDRAIAARFKAASGGAPTMTAGQYMAEQQRRFQETNARTFKRLDRDGDNKLTVQEFAGSELRLFARLDKNKNGILEPDEIRPRVRTADRSRGYD
jgi:Ca2+-binding EF-hand superfamily protein